MANKPTTEPVESVSREDVLNAIKEVLTTHSENWGIGPYEYAGARGVDVKMVAVVDQESVLVDITNVADPTDVAVVWDLPDVKGWIDSGHGYAEFTARNTGAISQDENRLLLEYEIS